MRIAAAAPGGNVSLPSKIAQRKENGNGSSGLDESGLQQLEELLRTLVKRGATVLMVSHDLEQVRRVANRVTVLDRSVITEGPAMETLAQERVVALLPSGGQGRARR